MQAFLSLTVRSTRSDNMREVYMQLHAASQDLARTFTIRNTSSEELAKHMRGLNQHIQQAATLKSSSGRQRVRC